MDNLSELVQTNAFQTPPTQLPSSLEYVRKYRLTSENFPKSDGYTHSATHK